MFGTNLILEFPTGRLISINVMERVKPVKTAPNMPKKCKKSKMPWPKLVSFVHTRKREKRKRRQGVC